ncbi:MAG: VWA domain-containing protein [Candidatus Binatia bacterium]
MVCLSALWASAPPSAVWIAPQLAAMGITMSPLFANIEFAKPAFFWLLIALPIIWFRLRDRRVAVLIARTLIVALVILTLADPQSASEQSRTEARIFAFDVSDSVPASLRQWMKESRNGVAAPKQNDHVFVFGSAAAEVADWQERLDGDRAKSSALQPEKTNLESLLKAVLAMPPGPRNLYLFTDGWETQGNVERLLPAVAAAGIKIYPVLPAGRPAIANVAISKLIAPTQGNSGENLNLKVVVENQSDRAVEGSLILARNGQTFKSDNVKVNPGSQFFSYQTTPAESGLTAFQASFTARDPKVDSYPADNRALAWVSVRAKAKILLVNGRSGAGRHLEEILKRQGLDVTVRTPENAPAPAGYKVVIFNNAERDKFSSGYLAAIERHTAAGNGFIMLGADASFAPTSYRQTAIERILPVEPREPPKREEKNRAVVLVVDKSGSMRDDNRIIYAKEAAKAVARQLRDIDLLGVVGFDDSPFVVVYLESMARLRGVVDNQIDRLKPGGQTYFLPALLEARRQLERANATRKHIILLSDGVTRGSQGELVDLVSAMKNDSKIIVSAVAISTEADVRIMKRLSQYGGGLFHHTVDPSSLPQIVLEQLQDKPKDDPQEGPWTPVADRGSDLLAGLSARTYPTVLGLMETNLKRGAQLDLMVQRQERRLPLLASWRYGQGKSIALTMDLEGRWSRNWIPWGGLQVFWNRILEWLVPVEENLVLSHEARVIFSENRSVLDLSIFEEAGANSHYRFSMTGKSGKTEGVLTKLAPGHSQAVLPASDPGDYRIDITEDRGGRRIAYPPVGYNLSYSVNSELPRPEFNTWLLTRLAEATGGEVNPRFDGTQNRTSVSKSHSPLKQPLIILAFCLFLLEVALRKFAFAEPD